MKNEFLEKELLELRKKYKYFYKKDCKDVLSVIGRVFISYKNIKNEYDIEIIIPENYPKAIPLARETKGKIPKDWHHNKGYFCLETPFNVWKIFREKETLLNFVDNLVVPYLISYSNYSNNIDCFKEHAHGARGVLDEYKKYFNVKDDLVAFKLLRILAEKSYRGHHSCPCGSGNKIRDCHGKYIRSIAFDKKYINYNFMHDYLEIGILLEKDNTIFDLHKYNTKEVSKYIKELKKNPNQKWGY